jgi:tetratricopeptide (TPR) repeat protein
LDYSQALKQYKIAMKQSPKNAECNFWIGCVLRRTGNWEKAKESYNKAFELDPRSSRIAHLVGYNYEMLREYSEALHYYDIAIRLQPDWSEPYSSKSRIYLKWNMDIQKARTILAEADQMITSTDQKTFLRHWMFLLELYDGNYQDALKYLSLEKSEAFKYPKAFIPRYRYFAQLYGLMNNPKLEYAYHDSSRLMLENKLIGLPDDPWLYSPLGIAFAGLGRKKEAIEAGEKAVELLPISKDALAGANRIKDLARIYVMTGEYEKALERIEFLLSNPGVMSANLMQLEPTWKPLWDHPEFIRLIEKYAEK